MTSKGLAPILALGLVLVLPVATHAQSDTWENATPIGNGLTAGNNLSATTGSPVASCGSIGNDVWYLYVATCTGTATASTCAPGTATFDTVIAAWFAPLPCGGPRPGQIACNDDACSGLRSTVSFAVIAGHTYYVSVGGFTGATGSFTLSMSCSNSAGPPPVNNTCANGTVVNYAALISGTNVGATSGGDPVGNCGAMGNDVWYSFVAPQSSPYVATTCLPGTDYDTVIAVWTGSACGSLVQIGCNDDGCYPGGPWPLLSTVNFNAVGGATYRISVGGFSGANGYFNLSLKPVSPMALSVGSSAVGNIGFGITQGPPNGTFFAAFTLNAGAFPNGWFFGIDIGAQELGQELLGSFPFWGALDSCGHVGVGPFTGLPSGLSLYGVALGFTTIGGSAPVLISSADSATVQ